MVREPGNNICNFVIPSTLLGLQDGFDRLNEWLTSENLKQSTKDRANLIYEEIVTNIIRYAFDDHEEHSIKIVFCSNPETLTFDFVDDGRSFDPRTVELRREPETLETAKIGGRGLLLVNSAAQSLEYERTADGRNHLVVALSRAERVK